MALRLYDAGGVAMANAFTALANGGRIRVYSGTRPAVNGVVGGASAVLAEFTLSATAFGTAANTGTNGTNRRARATLADLPLTDTSANNTGTASYAAILDSSLNVEATGTCGTAASNDFVIDNASIQQGQEINLTALNFDVPQE